MNGIDKTNPIPLYLQLANWMEKQIQENNFPVGSKIPSEAELSEKFDVNRNTLRHAIEILVRKGLLEKRKGIGTFVMGKHSLHPIHQLGRMTSFIDDFDLDKVEIEDRTLSKDVIEACSDLAAKLMIEPGERVIVIERIRIADKIPFVLEKQYYRYDDFSALLDIEIKGSMYRILTEELGADLHHSIQTIRAINPSREIAEKLKIKKTVPCILLESLAYTRENICIEVLQSYYRGDRYVFKVEAGQYRREMSSKVFK